MNEAAKEEAVDFSEGESLVVDMSGVDEAQEFEAIPAAMYTCQIIENEFGYSNEKGTPMWTLVLEVNEGEYAGRRLWNHWVMAGKGLPFTKKDIAQIAPELLEPFDASDPEIVASILGRDCRAKVTLGRYQGSPSNNVRGLYAVAEGGFAE